MTGQLTSVDVWNELQKRAGASDTDPAQWHLQRARGVTATQIRDLYLRTLGIAAGDSQAKLIADKVAMIRAADAGDMAEVQRLADAQWVGSKYTQWGHAREPIIAAAVAQEVPGMRPESRVFHAAGNERHLASPDGLLVTANGRIRTGEYKTGKDDLDLHGEAVLRKGYQVQMDWVSYVLDSDLAVYAWEQHDNEWEDLGGRWPEPTPISPFPVVQWYQPNQTRIRELVGIADAFLAALDAAVAGEVEPLDEVVDTAAVNAIRFLRDEQAASAAKDAQRERIDAHLRGKGLTEFTQKSALASVTWRAGGTFDVTENVERVEVDEERLQADHRPLWEQILLAKSELADAVQHVDELEQQWEALRELPEYRATSLVEETTARTTRKSLTIREARMDNENADKPRKGRK